MCGGESAQISTQSAQPGRAAPGSVRVRLHGLRLNELRDTALASYWSKVPSRGTEPASRGGAEPASRRLSSVCCRPPSHASRGRPHLHEVRLRTLRARHRALQHTRGQKSAARQHNTRTSSMHASTHAAVMCVRAPAAPPPAAPPRALRSWRRRSRRGRQKTRRPGKKREKSQNQEANEKQTRTQ